MPCPQWKSGQVVQLGWTAGEDLLCIQEDGTVLIYDLFCEFKRHFSMGNVSRGGAEHGKGRGARHHPVGRAGFGGQRGAVRPCSVISAPWGSAESLRPPLAPFGHELGAEQAPDLVQE